MSELENDLKTLCEKSQSDIGDVKQHKSEIVDTLMKDVEGYPRPVQMLVKFLCDLLLEL